MLAKKYKVEYWEHEKNFYAQYFQQDRNPFIDYPHLIDKIDFGEAFKK